MERSEIRDRSGRVTADPGLRCAPSGLRQKIFPQPFARRECFAEVKTVDDGQAEAAGRHGMALRLPVFVKGDLHTGDAGRALDLVEQSLRRMPVAATVRSEQHDAVTLAAVVVVKIPVAVFVKPDQGIDPART